MIKNLIKRRFASSVDYLGVAGFSPEIRELRETIRKFANEKVAPLAAQTDKNNKFPMHLWKEMGQLGILGITCPGNFLIFL